ncbi:adenosine deaminase family protein [Sorangium sp. So ce233]|uniref:adenosine deaminase family protein n=1 Tax=Sorangium sp. So ce233 TaxID=3133290 RepID=UPI003F63E72F
MYSRHLVPLLFGLLLGAPACGDDSDGGAGGTGGTGGGPGGTIEEQVAAKLEEIRGDHNAVQAFVLAMPKGGDLHSHTSGAVTPESMIAWGAADGACIDTTTFVASSGPCMDGGVPIADALDDQALYDSIVQAWSMEDFMGTLLEGHQHFFDSFGKFGGVLIETRGDDMVAQIRSTAGKNNQVYVELMQGFGSGTVGGIAEAAMMPDDVWDEPYLLEKRAEILEDPGFETAIDAAKASIESALSGSDTLLRCGTPAADPGCNVDVRFLVAANRTRPRAHVFGQWVFAFELAQVVPEIVGVNLVSPEENANSLRYYNDEMMALNVLDRFNEEDTTRKPVHVGLHAGELIPEVLPMTPEGQMELDYHIRSAVEIARAERIGHGVDALGEMAGGGADDLLSDMARMGVMVEICLTSNDALLDVEGREHPLKQYMAKGVPVALSTDDQGILRIDITHEYARAVEEHGLTYPELKKLARTSLEHAFLAGASLWKTRDDFSALVDACASDSPGATPSAACEAFLQASDKARIQWRHEGATMAFEASVVNR